MADGRKPTARGSFGISLHGKSFGAGVPRAGNLGGQSLQRGGLLSTGGRAGVDQVQAFQASSVRLWQA